VVATKTKIEKRRKGRNVMWTVARPAIRKVVIAMAKAETMEAWTGMLCDHLGTEEKERGRGRGCTVRYGTWMCSLRNERGRKCQAKMIKIRDMQT
jgi:hypothetical protein